MPLRDILVHINDHKNSPDRVQAAIQLAAKHDAHLCGLYVLPNPEIPGYVDIQMPVELIEIQEQRLKEVAGAAEKKFDEMTKRSGISAEWRCQKGIAAKLLAEHGRYADLIIVGQPVGDDGGAFGSDETTEEIILTAGRPVLVIPNNFKEREIGTNVLVGWDRGQRSTRALHDALPLLQKASAVSVLTVNTEAEDGGVGHLPGVDIAHHLARHDIQVEADHVTNLDLSVADHLLSRAADKGSDLLVAGAYGHARWRELILGGVTQDLLETMPIPVLMSH